jgi:hypothetical protein
MQKNEEIMIFFANHWNLHFQPHYGLSLVDYDREEEELNLALALSKSGKTSLKKWQNFWQIA